MWPKFSNTSISIRELIIVGNGTKYGLEISHQSWKMVKTKSQKVWGANFCICRCYWEKYGTAGGEGGLPLPSPDPESG